jgi:hypothetical protein
MKKIRVVWGCRTPIGPDHAEEVRTMTREFSSAKQAAEFACDIIFVLDGPQSANANTDKFYIVGPSRPRVEFQNNVRTWWVEVTYLSQYPEYGGGVKTLPAALAP